MAARRLADREAMEDVFDRMLTLRGEMARAAGFADYVGTTRSRFTSGSTTRRRIACGSTTPSRRTSFRCAVRCARNAACGWASMCCGPGTSTWTRKAARPCARSRTRANSRAGPGSFSPDSTAGCAPISTLMERGGLLDLASRKGKAPGGYQQTLAEARVPFIFMNAAGTQNDVRTLIHEAGHAFHALAAREQRPAALPRRAHRVLRGGVHGDGAAGRAPAGRNIIPGRTGTGGPRVGRATGTGMVELLPWVAVVDAFQHWLYTHPGHSRAERAARWMELVERFGGGEDWSGHEDARRYFWQRQLHFFQVPFYYVEYGIAQLGALQLWQRARQDPAGAVESYYAGLRLGGSKPLPALFAAAGLRFDFSDGTVDGTAPHGGRCAKSGVFPQIGKSFRKGRRIDLADVRPWSCSPRWSWALLDVRRKSPASPACCSTSRWQICRYSKVQPAAMERCDPRTPVPHGPPIRQFADWSGFRLADPVAAYNEFLNVPLNFPPNRSRVDNAADFPGVVAPASRRAFGPEGGEFGLDVGVAFLEAPHGVQFHRGPADVAAHSRCPASGFP